MKRDRPDVLTSLQPRDPVAPGLNEGCLYAEQAPWHPVEKVSRLALLPGVHVIHRGEGPVQRLDVQPDCRLEELAIPAGESLMHMQVGLRAGTQARKVAVLKRGLER